MISQAVRNQVDAVMTQDRPFRNTPTSKLKFALGVGEAGLKSWPGKHTANYRKCEVQVDHMRKELALRGS